MKEKKRKERLFFNIYILYIYISVSLSIYLSIYICIYIRVIITTKSETKVQFASERDPEHLCRINKQGVGEEGGGGVI